ncbi:MAG: sugar phosphate isomerase/epimerase family protein [Vicinamibacterales bacterium]
MQGRLLPPVDGRIQAFPAADWRAEFGSARSAGLDCIEWIFEEPGQDSNPVATDSGLDEMRRLSAETGVAVRSICADYYMTRPLLTDEGPVPSTVSHLRWLVGRAGALGVEYVVLPFVDASSLPSASGRRALAEVLHAMGKLIDEARVELHLETDWQPDEVATFLAGLAHPLIKANYDIGNSAALGHDPKQGVRTLAGWLGSVHVKDRVLGGGTVPLGTGHADLPTSFREIRAAGFRRPYILQVARGEPGQESSLAIHNREYVERLLERAEQGEGSEWN